MYTVQQGSPGSIVVGVRKKERIRADKPFILSVFVWQRRGDPKMETYLLVWDAWYVQLEPTGYSKLLKHTFYTCPHILPFPSNMKASNFEKSRIVGRSVQRRSSCQTRASPCLRIKNSDSATFQAGRPGLPYHCNVLSYSLRYEAMFAEV